jgi:signal peptidase I
MPPTPNAAAPKSGTPKTETSKAAKARAKPQAGGILETIKTLFYAGLIAIGIRTVAFEPFNIPSGSMIPTLLVGDFVFVSKYSYGYSRFSFPFSPPLFSGRIFGSLPHRGDVVVFRNTRNTSEDWIKRVIGLPGDRIQVKQGQLYINGTEVPRAPEGDYEASDENQAKVLTKEYLEALPDGPKHHLLKYTDDPRNVTGELDANNTDEYLVPAGHLFMMGDNRDNSADSRFMEGLGFVPVENLIGRAQFIFFSFDAVSPWWEFWEWPLEVRWSRLLKGVD